VYFKFHVNVFSLDTFSYFYQYDHDSNGLSARAIAGVSVGSAVSFITVSILLLATFVCVRHRYMKRRHQIHNVTNPRLLVNESSDMVPPDFSQPPAYTSTQHMDTTFGYNQPVNDCDTASTSRHPCEATSGLLTEYTSTRPPLDDAFNDVLRVTPTTQDVQ